MRSQSLSLLFPGTLMCVSTEVSVVCLKSCELSSTCTAPTSGSPLALRMYWGSLSEAR